VKKYVGPQVQAAMGISMDDFFSQGGAYGYTLQPMLKIHLHPEVDRELEPAGNMSNIYIMITIMIFVLIIACINFMNLSTARFSTRAREVGVRKTLGASKSLLIVQFLGESFLLTFFSFLIAMVILAILLSHFNLLAGKELAFDMLLRTDLIPGLILMLIIVAIISGSYPAFYLSSFRPVEVLKGKIRTGKGSGLIRRSLVVFQFFISIVLIISTLIIFKQLKYLDKKDPGFNKDNVMVIRNADALGSNKISFKEELKNMTGVSCASIVTRTPPDVDYTDIFIPVHEDAKDIGFNYCFADEDLQKTLGLTMASGRYFSHEFPSDSGGIIINEAALKMIGREDFTGEKIRTHWEHMKEPRQVIGVVKDFNFQTLEKGITPLAIFPGSQGNQILVRFSQGDNSGIIKRVESKWRAFTDGFPFEYSFIEEDFSAKFRKEQKLAGIFMLFTILAIFIACMGLFGLSTFMAEQRRKEMGIRKVLGATLTLILRTMSREFFVLVLVAFLLASPVTYLILSLWLNGFAYRTSIDLLTILVGGVAAFLVTIISVAYQSINVASKNPVESLKYE
jgi:putative ABC transport system permease protein